jgi:hypothetical protein
VNLIRVVFNPVKGNDVVPSTENAKKRVSDLQRYCTQPRIAPTDGAIALYSQNTTSQYVKTKAVSAEPIHFDLALVQSY